MSDFTAADVEAGAKAWDEMYDTRYGDNALDELGPEVLVILSAVVPAMRNRWLKEASTIELSTELGDRMVALRAPRAPAR